MIYTILNAINLPKLRHIFQDILYCHGCIYEPDHLQDIRKEKKERDIFFKMKAGIASY